MDLPGEIVALLAGAAGGFFAARFSRNGSQPNTPAIASPRTERQNDDSLEELITLMPVAALIV
ncbi:MAG: hypothetical protein ACREML_02055, partial [Vulcanimicrobiaceae bacterium]